MRTPETLVFSNLKKDIQLGDVYSPSLPYNPSYPLNPSVLFFLSFLRINNIGRMVLGGIRGNVDRTWTKVWTMVDKTCPRLSTSSKVDS